MFAAAGLGLSAAATAGVTTTVAISRQQRRHAITTAQARAIQRRRLGRGTAYQQRPITAVRSIARQQGSIAAALSNSRQ